MNIEKDTTAELHESKESEVELLYKRGKLIEEAKEGKLWDKMGFTESQYFQGELGITRVEEEFAEDIYFFLMRFPADRHKEMFNGLTLGKVKLIIPELKAKWEDNDYDLIERVVDMAKNMLYKDLRDELRGEADDGKCTKDCPFEKQEKVSWWCPIHRKRVYIDPTGKLDN